MVDPILKLTVTAHKSIVLLSPLSPLYEILLLNHLTTLAIACSLISWSNSAHDHTMQNEGTLVKEESLL